MYQEQMENKQNHHFLKKSVPIKQVGDCYIARTHHNYGGYIALNFNHRTVLMHRLVYTYTHGEIPEGMVVRHLCHNRDCINPRHLVLGTQADNINDAKVAGRTPIGERNGRVKLTEAKVRQILKFKRLNNSELARRYNVSTRLIRMIRQGKIWKHITAEAV